MSNNIRAAAQRPQLWLLAVLLVALVATTYGRVGEAGFIWDDDAHLTENPCIVGPLGLIEIWTTKHARICPLTLTSFRFQYWLWGLNPLPYHWVNVALFAASAVVLWRVLETLKIPGAWLGAALWALHPMQVESVAWITEHKNTLSGFFFLICIHCYLHAHSKAARFRRLLYVGSLACGFLAMAGKSSTVVLPIILGFCDWWQDRAWHWKSFRKLIPFFVMAVGSSALSIWTQHGEGAFDPRFARGLMERLAIPGSMIWFYLGKFAWPEPLVFIYPRFEFRATNLLGWFPLIAVLVTFGVAWRFRYGMLRPIWMALGCYVAALLPILGLIDHYFLRFTYVGDHFQYLASMCPAALVAGVGTRLARMAFPHARCIRIVAAGCFVAILGWSSHTRVPVFFDNLKLWETTVALSPDAWIARTNLGVALAQSSRNEEAIPHLRRSLELNPRNEVGLYNLGILLSMRGDYTAAVDCFRRAAVERPNDSMIYSNLGAALRLSGHAEESIEALAKALSIDPSNHIAATNLGDMLLSDGRFLEAADVFRTLLQSKQNDKATRANLVTALDKAGRFDEAVAVWRTAIEIDPNDDHAMVMLAHKLFLVGKLEEAETLARRAVSANSSNDSAYCLLGNINLLAEKFDEAVVYYESSVALNPENAEAHNNLGAALFAGKAVSRAVFHWKKALAIDPHYLGAAVNLGQALLQVQRASDAIEVYRDFLKTSPDTVEILDRLAWLLATHPVDALRNARLAVDSAERAVQLTDEQNPTCLRTLAAAYAEAGRFQDAVDRAEAAGNHFATPGQLRAEIIHDLSYYRQSIAVRDRGLPDTPLQVAD